MVPIRFTALQKLPPRYGPDKDKVIREDIRRFRRETGDTFGVQIYSVVSFDEAADEKVHYAIASGKEARQFFQHALKLATSYYMDPLPQGRVLLERFEAARASLFGKLQMMSNQALAARDQIDRTDRSGPNRALEIQGVKVHDLTFMDLWVEDKGKVVTLGLKDLEQLDEPIPKAERWKFKNRRHRFGKPTRERVEQALRQLMAPVE